MTTKEYETVLIEKQDGITWLIMNRPDKRNAMSPQLHLEMDDALAELAVDPQTHVLVLTGAGEAFCAGQDIKLYFRANDDAPAERAKARHASNQWRWHRLSNFPQPTIAMVNGYCFGGGFTQVCACDCALAADEGAVRTFRSQLGDSAGRHRVLERRADLELPRRHVLRAHRRYLRRQKGAGDRLRELLLSQGQAEGRDDQARQEADGKEPGRPALHQGGASRGALHERAPGGRLPQRQERGVALCRQGRQPRPGHEAVSRRKDLSSGLR